MSNIEDLKQKLLDLAAQDFDQEFEYYKEHAEECNKWLQENAPDYVMACLSYVSNRCLHSLQYLKAQDDFLKAMSNEKQKG